jgi:hypothetical protein
VQNFVRSSPDGTHRTFLRNCFQNPATPVSNFSTQDKQLALDTGNSDAPNVPSFRHWRFLIKLSSPFSQCQLSLALLLRCPSLTDFPRGNLVADSATLADHCNLSNTIAQEASDAPSLGNGTLLLLHFYEDDIVIPYATYDQFFSRFERLRLPLSTRHLAALHTFPSSAEDFVRSYFAPLFDQPED